MKKIVVLMMSAVIALSSCNKKGAVVAGSSDISFLTDEIRTRVANNLFELGDEISVQALQNGAAYQSAIYSYAGNSNEFTSESPISYRSDDPIELSYQAVYPAIESFASTFTHTIATNLSDVEAYEASDLLVATVEETSSLKPELKFVHRMSRVNLDIVVKRDGVVSTSETVSDVKINAVNTVNCDIAADSYTSSGSVVEITPQGTNLEYVALVAPQNIAANNFAVASVNGSNFSMANVAATLVSGYVYDLTWTIDIVTGTHKVEIEGAIDDWTQGNWGGDDSATDDNSSVVPPVTNEYSAEVIMRAMGETSIPDNPGLKIDNVEFDDFSLTSDAGPGDVNFRLFPDNTIRSYAGNTVTITAKSGKMVKSVKLDNAEISSATAGSIDGGAWSGSAPEVTLTLEMGVSKTIIIVVE